MKCEDCGLWAKNAEPPKGDKYKNLRMCCVSFDEGPLIHGVMYTPPEHSCGAAKEKVDN